MLPGFVRPDKPPQRTSTEDTSPSFRHSIAPRGITLRCARRAVARHPRNISKAHAGTAGPGHKIAKTTPCKVEWAPGSQHSCCIAFGVREQKWSVVTAQPNLIPL